MNKLDGRPWKRDRVVLIDANVILNYITDREDKFRESSKVVMDLCSHEKVDGYLQDIDGCGRFT